MKEIFFKNLHELIQKNVDDDNCIKKYDSLIISEVKCSVKKNMDEIFNKYIRILNKFELNDIEDILNDHLNDLNYNIKIKNIGIDNTGTIFCKLSFINERFENDILEYKYTN